MGRNIFKTRTGIGGFADGRARLFVEFADTKDKPQGDLEWTPRWDDVRDLIVQAVEVERRNRPGSTYLTQFADVCSEVIVKYAPAENVELVGGRLTRYWTDATTGKAWGTVLYREITDRPGWIAGQEDWEWGVPLTEDQLRDLINKDVEWLVWNRRVVQIRDRSTGDRIGT